MSKYDLSWNQEKLQRYIKEGRGQGEGKDYKPWITVHDFPSEGITTKLPSPKTGRSSHFLSLNEYRLYLLLEWAGKVTDIREQYPMDLKETMRIAEELGIKHPEDNVSKVPYVMTTDFMITMNNEGKKTYVVRTVKPAKMLESKNVIEHFEIERRYWLEKGIDWRIVTDLDIPVQLASNIEWAYYSYNLSGGVNEDEEILLYYGELLKERLATLDSRIVTVCSRLDSEMNLETGTSLHIFKYLLTRKEIVMDMFTKPCTSCSTNSITKIIKKENRLVI